MVQNKIYFPIRDRSFAVCVFQLSNLHPMLDNFYTTSSGLTRQQGSPSVAEKHSGHGHQTATLRAEKKNHSWKTVQVLLLTTFSLLIVDDNKRHSWYYPLDSARNLLLKGVRMKSAAVFLFYTFFPLVSETIISVEQLCWLGSICLQLQNFLNVAVIDT